MRRQDAVTVILIVLVLTLKLAGFSFIVILTDSMEPTVYPGSLVVTAPPSLVEPGVGRIILYTVNLGGHNFTIMHRVIGEFERNGTVYFITKGDNRRFPDQWVVPASNVKGVYLFSVRYVGYLLLIPMRFYKIYALAVVFTAFTVSSYIVLREVERVRRRRVVAKVKSTRAVLWVLKRKRKRYKP